MVSFCEAFSLPLLIKEKAWPLGCSVGSAWVAFSFASLLFNSKRKEVHFRPKRPVSHSKNAK